MLTDTRRIRILAARRRKCLQGASSWRAMRRVVDSPWERITCEHAEHRWLSAADRIHTKLARILED